MSPKRGVAPLRRTAIVRATIRCLARDGYTGLTMKKVAREAGVSQVNTPGTNSSCQRTTFC